MVELYPYRGAWDANDPDANFKEALRQMIAWLGLEATTWGRE